MVSSRRGNKRPLLHEPEGESWMARTIFPPNKPKVEDALHKSAGRFSCTMLKFVKIWYIIDKAWCDWNISVGGEKCRLKNRRTDLKLV